MRFVFSPVSFSITVLRDCMFSVRLAGLLWINHPVEGVLQWGSQNWFVGNRSGNHLKRFAEKLWTNRFKAFAYCEICENLDIHKTCWRHKFVLASTWNMIAILSEVALLCHQARFQDWRNLARNIQGWLQSPLCSGVETSAAFCNVSPNCLKL